MARRNKERAFVKNQSLKRMPTGNIDNQYKSLPYMADYDFTNENILKRINNI